MWKCVAWCYGHHWIWLFYYYATCQSLLFLVYHSKLLQDQQNTFYLIVVTFNVVDHLKNKRSTYHLAATNSINTPSAPFRQECFRSMFEDRPCHLIGAMIEAVCGRCVGERFPGSNVGLRCTSPKHDGVNRWSYTTGVRSVHTLITDMNVVTILGFTFFFIVPFWGRMIVQHASLREKRQEFAQVWTYFGLSEFNSQKYAYTHFDA